MSANLDEMQRTSLESGQSTACTQAELQAALLSTLAYSDIFGYPLTLPEIHRYLCGVRAAPTEIADALSTLLADAKIVAAQDRFALASRERLFGQRREREAIASRLWPTACRYARILASIPTVSMVGVTGSLAAGNPADEADIDFMLIVEGGTLWRTRAAAKLLQQLDQMAGGSMCVNYLRSERALELPQQDLYTARELIQMVPLFGLEAYAALREANGWTQELLPNAGGPPWAPEPVAPFRLLRAATRPFFNSIVGQKVEAWEARRKISRYNDSDFLPTRYSVFEAEATGHRLDVKTAIAKAHRERLEADTSGQALRVLIGQSYCLYFDQKLWREMRPYAPLGSLYAAATVRSAGHDVSFYDAMLSTEISSWAATLDRERPQVVVLYEDNFNYLTKMCLSKMRDAALVMIQSAKRVGTCVIVAGSDATDNPARYLTAGADYVIVGEGEDALVRLLGTMTTDAQTDARSIPSVAYRAADGTVVVNARLPTIRALDELPPPAWDLVDTERYARIWRHRRGYVSMNVATTRGCPYHCNWCAKPIWGQGYNVRSPENVATEIAQLRQLAGVEHVWFMDDIFGLKPRWVARFADALEANGVSIRFKCLTRPDLLRRPGEIEALKRAGCETVWIGAESGSQTILDAMEKGTKVEDIAHITQALKAAGIRVGFFVQFGYPGEGMREIRSTRRMIRQLLPDELGVSVSYPLPGTTFYERVKNQLGTHTHWNDSDDLAMLFGGRYRTAFYRALHRLVHRELAWHRVRRQIKDRSIFRLSRPRMLRRLASFALTSLRLPFTWISVLTLSLVPNRGVDGLPIALDHASAATPSPQPD